MTTSGQMFPGPSCYSTFDGAMKEIIGAHEAAARSLSVMQKVASTILNHDHSSKLEHCQKMEGFCRKLKV